MKKNLRKSLYMVLYAFLCVGGGAFFAEASWAAELSDEQASIMVRGKVVSFEDGEGLPGVNIRIKDANVGVITDIEGNYAISVPSQEAVLVFSFIGYETVEEAVGSRTTINVTLIPDITSLGEVVIIGYGEQKKETVVGAVTQVSGDILERTGGISNVGAALTGNLPGLITNSSTGMPGQENPQIYIRGRNTWNSAEPLILVDGVERPDFFNVMDISSVESISVLKDASTTAVFGSRGANGVIIITTKRGREGKAEITATANSTLKWVSKLPGKYDSYDAIGVRNRAIEYELGLAPDGWNEMIPEAIRYKYRYPANEHESVRYPNVDWQNELFKDYAMAFNANLGIRGGTELVKYFASVDFQNEDDMFREFDSGRGYTAGYGYNRMNFRSNLDFQITPTTQLQANLGGTYAVRKRPRVNLNEYNVWDAAYNGAPDVFVPRYPDGTWAYYLPNEQGAQNSVRNIATNGFEKITDAHISTTFVLNQDLDMILPGLDFSGTLAVDNEFREGGRGVNDANNALQLGWMDPETGEMFYKNDFQGTTYFDFYDEGAKWSVNGGGINRTFRKIFYQFQLNYAGTIADDHNYSFMGLMNRQQWATNSEVPSYREDWVFRATYNYRNKYMIEYNGAYNGSEKFAPEYRFAFFSSGGVGWNISEEPFLKSVSFIDILKLRGSYGEVGNDHVGGYGRWLFADQWAYGGNAMLGLMGAGGEASPYTYYRVGSLGNPSVRWETAYKYNVGLDFTLFDGLVDGTVEYFTEDRKDILLGDRAVPSYFGQSAPVANLGRVESQGYEITLGLNHTFDNGLNVWSKFAMTHTENEVIERDDPKLLNDYQKQAGYAIGQARTHISSGFYNTWDELYASTPHNANNLAKLPGNFHIIDYNGDGVIDNFDSAPYAFTGIPENTYSTSVGFDWKGLSMFVQFYGVNNVTRQVVFGSLGGKMNRVYEQGTYWSKDAVDPETPMPRWLSTPAGYNSGSRYFYDASYLRLKNMEIGYRFTSDFVKRIGLQSFRIYVSGNNLLLWTDMPDDRESNFAGTGWASQGAYPTTRRFNLGLNVTF